MKAMNFKKNQLEFPHLVLLFFGTNTIFPRTLDGCGYSSMSHGYHQHRFAFHHPTRIQRQSVVAFFLLVSACPHIAKQGQNCFLRVIPALTHYAHTLFWHSFWYTIGYIDECMYVCMHACSDILSGIYSDILSGIYSDKVSGIYADIPPFYSILSLYSGSLSGIYSGILSDIGTAGPQPPAPNLSGQCPLRARGWSSAVRTEIWACGWGWGGEEEKRRDKI